MADNMEDLRKLRARVEEITKDMNLELTDFSVTPGTSEDGTDYLTVSAFIKVEALETAAETEQRGIDDAFSAIFSAEFGDSEDFADDETKKLIERDREREEKAKADLQAMIEELEGK